MKNIKTAGLTAFVLLSICGCSTPEKRNPVYPEYATTAYPGISQEAMSEWVKPFTYPLHTRGPSSEMVSAPKYFWEADTLKVPLTSGSTIDQDYKIKFNQYSAYELREKVIVNVPKLETVWEEQEELVLVCNTKSGVGKSEYWNTFYSAPMAQKPQALANAIEGVGDATAKKLVGAHYFSSKPKSWNDFEDEIHQATREKVNNKLNEYQILYKFRQENMKKLGYNTQATGDCHLVMERHSYPHDVMVNVAVETEQIVPHRDLISTDFRNYHIQISGQRLQSFEQEMLVFSFDHETNQISLAPATYNNYSLSIEDLKVNVVGTSRKNIKLPSDVLPAGATLESSNGMASFTAPVNSLYVPKTQEDGHLVMSIEIHTCKKGLFGCAVFGRDEIVQPTVVQVVQPKSGLVNYKFPVSPGRKVWVRYWINAAASPWYTNNVIVSEGQPEI